MFIFVYLIKSLIGFQSTSGTCENDRLNRLLCFFLRNSDFHDSGGAGEQDLREVRFSP
jgi:hypothetical protein